MNTDTDTDTLAEERRSLPELYTAARAEGGKLTVYAGGDFAAQQDGTANAFRAAFPAIDFEVVVDYSKYHNIRIDRQLRDGDLIPDVTHLQTTFDFDRWKALGVLMRYRPTGFEQVYEGFKDPDGYFVAIGTFAFSFMHGTGGGPATPKNLIDPEWRGRIASAFPQDDDATLFLFKKYVDIYGWKWLDALAQQQLRFGRGTNSPGDEVGIGRAQVGVGGYNTGASGLTWVVPQGEHPFFAWGQRAAIFRDAKHPEAAKLYLNWLLSEGNQRNAFKGWSVRKDLVPEGGSIWTIPNAHVDEFIGFMADRALVEWWRQTMVLHLGEVRGEPSPGWLGLRPTQQVR